MYDQIVAILSTLPEQPLDPIECQVVTDKIMVLVESEIEQAKEESADDKLWDFECQQLQDLLWKSRTTGTPDMFSEELRSFWDNGKPGNT